MPKRRQLRGFDLKQIEGLAQLIGVDEAKVQSVIDLLRQSCSPPDPSRGVVFVVDAPFFEQI